eukprot:7390502-Prymnesium_polylepis.1
MTADGGDRPHVDVKSCISAPAYSLPARTPAGLLPASADSLGRICAVPGSTGNRTHFAGGCRLPGKRMLPKDDAWSTERAPPRGLAAPCSDLTCILCAMALTVVVALVDSTVAVAVSRQLTGSFGLCCVAPPPASAACAGAPPSPGAVVCPSAAGGSICG